MLFVAEWNTHTFFKQVFKDRSLPAKCLFPSLTPHHYHRVIVTLFSQNAELWRVCFGAPADVPAVNFLAYHLFTGFDAARQTRKS